jgi:uncharacterized protein (DUF302 family)
MKVIRNLFAVIGFLVTVAGVVLFASIQEGLDRFDPEAPRIYLELAKEVLKTRNAAEATAWKFPVNEELSADDVEETMKFVANEHNMSNVGELPLSKDIEAKSGEPYRFVKIFLFCDSLTAARMLDYSDFYSAYLPCRITLVEDQEGKLWLFALNMDLMIYGGEPLPPVLKAEAIKVKEILLDIMRRGAEGEF